MGLNRILIQHSDGRRIPVEPAEIFYLEAEAHDTLVRLRSKRRLRDDRSMGQLEKLLGDYYLLRVHRNFVVNLRRVAEIRARKKGEGWELKMEPPVNRVIPIGETYEAALWKAFEL
jgi:DNA-binding LytR/AlgR family response regulator